MCRPDHFTHVVVRKGDPPLYYRELIYGLAGWYAELDLAERFYGITAQRMAERLNKRGRARHGAQSIAALRAALSETEEEKDGK